jgi:DNA-binding LytR/AlgR family response regulator
MKKNTQSFVFIREAGRNIRLDLQQILYIEARRNYTRVVTRDKTFMQLVVLNKWERILPPDQFCQVHRSFIVSIGSITAFDRKFVYLPNINIPFGEAYRDMLLGRVTILGTESRHVSVRTLEEAPPTL